MKKLLAITLALTMAASLLAGCGSSDKKPAGGEQSIKYVLKLSTQLNEADPLVEGFKKFKKNVETRTKGNLVVEIFPSAQLGSDEDVIEQLRQGANVAVLTDGGRMANFVKDIGIIGCPYIVDDYAQVEKLVASPSFKKWEADLQKKSGIKVLAFNWYHGPRHFLTNKTVKSPDDLKGVRIRTPGAPVWQESIKSMGATPVAMGWTEVYPSIQQKVIDGAEAQHLASYTSRLYEVAKFIVKTGHFQLINGIIAGDKWFNGLPKEYQAILVEEANKVGTETAKVVIGVADQYEKKMVDAGMTVVVPDVAAFKKASEKAYDALGYKELRKQVQAEIAK